MEVSNSQVEEITRHHFYTLDELESLLQSLRMELEVAPTDHKAHRNLFSRIALSGRLNAVLGNLILTIM